VSGASSLSEAVASGFSGMVEAPMRGAEKKGALGFAQGVGWGLYGLVVKPMTGLFDGVAKLSEGVKNGQSDAVALTVQPIRPARMFYGSDRTLRVYNRADACVHVLLVRNGIAESFSLSVAQCSSA
jgi:vacuolar protein sorting-associated protein 13A/C